MTRGKKIAYGIILFILFIGATAGTMFYFDFSQKYVDHFLPGTQINGVNVGEKTIEEAEAALTDSRGEYSLDIIFPDGSTESVSGEDIGFHYIFEDRVRNILNEQNRYKWPLGHINILREKYAVSPSFDRAKLSLAVHRMPETLQDPDTTDYTTNAHVAYEEGAFRVIPEHQGNDINPFAMYRVAADTVRKAERQLYVEQRMEDILVHPQILSTDPGLQANADQLNNFRFASVTYVTSDGTNYVLDGNVMKDWLLQDSRGDLYVDEAYWDQKLTEYVSWLAENVNTVNKEHVFHTTDGRDVTLRGTEYYGWKIDEEKELDKLRQEVTTAAVSEREPVYSKREGAYLYDNNGFGNSYIEIDLGKQHMYIYKNGEMVLETDVVSGTNTPKRRTPDGAFTTYDKQRDRILRGDVQTDGTFGYETYVAYWIRLTNTGIGLHDAYWRGAFGGEIWRYSGSHGCINCPAKLMPQIYEVVDEGMPVAVFYD